MTRATEPIDAAFRRLFDLSLDVLCISGFDGYLRSCNHAYTRVLGYTDAELLARPFWALIHPDDLVSAQRVVAELEQGNDVFGFQCRMIHTDGSVRWLEWNTRPVLEEGLMYSVGRDITDRRMADDELRALRRIATFVAEAVEPTDLFAIVAEQVAQVMGVQQATILRYEPDDTATECAFFVAGSPDFEGHRRWSLEGASVLSVIRRTGEAARINDWSHLKGQQAEASRHFGIHSTVGVPVIVAGRLWGAVVVNSVEPDALPDDTEDRLADFTQLLATAVANAESRDALKQLADEQAALGRVATLAVQGVAPSEILAAVSDEVDGLFGTAALVLRFDRDGTGVIFAAISKSIVIPEGIEVRLGTRWALEDAMASAEVYRTGRPARSDNVDWGSRDSSYAAAGAAQGVVSSVASPIVVHGHLWGVMLVYSTEDLLPLDTEARLERFTDLVATVIVNAESRDALKQLADEQAALRRVATLVARGVPAGQVFQAVSQEVGDLLGTDTAYVSRFDHDGPALVTMGVTASDPDAMVGARWELDDSMSTAMVYRTGRSARVDDADWEAVTAHVATVGRRLRTASAVSSPITVEGRLWGAVSVAAPDPLPADTADRLDKFTELLSTAIANAESREALARLADEQAALRHAATLAVEGVEPTEIFSTVCEEVARLIGADVALIGRFEHDPPAVVVVGFSSEIPGIPIGARSELAEGYAATGVYRSRRSSRVEARSKTGSFFKAFDAMKFASSVASPVTVDGILWGTISVSSAELLPHDTETRLEKFTQLLSTAIAHAKSREALAELADDQAALRRVATLVAHGVPPDDIFAAVTQEVDRLFGSDQATVGRFEADGPAFAVLGAAKHDDRIPLGSHWELNDLYVASRVFETRRSARVSESDLVSVGGPVADDLRAQGFISQVASPIVVEGELWGALTVTARETLPPGTEARLVGFSDLIATALANAQNKAELSASRRRIVAASDRARRKIERDLHDGTQQRLVALGLSVRAAEADAPSDAEQLRAELARIAAGVTDAVTELQEISRGIHPPVLARGGLDPALHMLAHRSSVPVDLDVTVAGRLPEAVEVAAYYVVSEAVANVAKHAKASLIGVRVEQHDEGLRLAIRDNGVGGADPAEGSGLVGLTDRVTALGGSLRIASPPNQGTTITAEFPLTSDPANEAT